ncbi:hypothetical protein B1207_15055 [Legionella quinlivanii]|uniref:Uncharacterized protein n=1 Tax=Legionella quinlivanii TaxID=45073 RepID=A0A364LFB7_9GAMM|nr:hypothetical protein [Legionella quinlivanii]RAP34602.1 hypothetical protein B1207_15055 [Legionella quinlivanii]
MSKDYEDVNPAPPVARDHLPQTAAVIDADPEQYVYAKFEMVTKADNVQTVRPGDTKEDGTPINGIFTAGMTTCVALAFIVRDEKGNISQISMMHVPGSIGSSTFEGIDGIDVEGPAIMDKMLKGAPKGSSVEVVVGWSKDSYVEDFKIRGKTTLIEAELSETIQKVITERGYKLDKIETYWGAKNNLSGSACSFGINLQGERGEFKNCRGNCDQEMASRIKKTDSPGTPSMAAFMLNWARTIRDKVFFNDIKKDLASTNNPDFDEVKKIGFDYSKAELPLNDMVKLKEMMVLAREKNDARLWATIKDALVEQIQNRPDKAAAVAERKELLSMHFKGKDSNGEYKGSGLCRMFQGGETAHWRQVKQFEDSAQAVMQKSTEMKAQLRLSNPAPDTQPLLESDKEEEQENRASISA